MRVADAQKDYCEKSLLPLFSPSDGVCPMCSRNIYAGSLGYSEVYASTHLITACPYCRRSFVD